MNFILFYFSFRTKVMVEVQRMFSFLQESHKQYYDPAGFAFAYKDYEGSTFLFCLSSLSHRSLFSSPLPPSL